MKRQQSRRKFSKRRRRNVSTRQAMPNALLHDQKMPLPMMIPPSRVVKVQLGGFCGVSANGSGVLAAAIPFDPSATLSSALGGGAAFSEWTNYSNLYQNVKVLQFEVELVRLIIDDAKGDTPGSVLIASSTSPTLVVPSSYAQVADNGDAQMWPVTQDYSGRGRYHACKFTTLTWALTSTPNPGSSTGIGAGCPGSIIFYGVGFPNNAGLAHMKYRGTYLLRTRV
jgi:hypothetical protein